MSLPGFRLPAIAPGRRAEDEWFPGVVFHLSWQKFVREHPSSHPRGVFYTGLQNFQMGLEFLFLYWTLAWIVYPSHPASFSCLTSVFCNHSFLGSPTGEATYVWIFASGSTSVRKSQVPVASEYSDTSRDEGLCIPRPRGCLGKPLTHRNIFPLLKWNCLWLASGSLNGTRYHCPEIPLFRKNHSTQFLNSLIVLEYILHFTHLSMKENC